MGKYRTMQSIFRILAVIGLLGIVSALMYFSLEFLLFSAALFVVSIFFSYLAGNKADKKKEPRGETAQEFIKRKHLNRSEIIAFIVLFIIVIFFIITMYGI